MREISYRSFSLKNHCDASVDRLLTFCQFELTFRCGLRCKHCYAGCYNTRDQIRNELSRRQIERILDKLRAAGVLWLCLTGGDCLAREDFPEIYAYAKRQGFIITIFTSAAQLSRRAAGCLEKNPPFLIEITLNALDEALYERISQVKGSYARVMGNISRLKDAGIPVKIKTQVTRDNIDQVPGIGEFAKKQGFVYMAAYDLYPRLNKDTSVCSSRVSAEAAMSLPKEYGPQPRCLDAKQRKPSRQPYVFLCPAGSGRSIYVDPYGRAFLCPLIRTTGVNLLKTSISRALAKLKPLFLNRRYKGKSACRSCRLSAYCPRCPGEAYLETGDIEAPIPYYCELTRKLFTRKSGA